MSTIELPGFTAEASLHRTRERYQMAGDVSGLAEGQGVFPQLRLTCPDADGVGCLLLRGFCSIFGGGMASNTGGGESCFFN